jgi:DHA1 family bicyclomycin/chloramphenicol resistance-like MFS transporter
MTQTKLRSGLILLIGALGMFQPLSLDPYMPNIGPIARDLNVQASLIAQNLTFLTLGVSVGLVIAGPLSDAIGRRRPVLFALAGFALASFATTFVTSYEMFFTLRSAQGFFAACAAVVANAMLRDLYQGLLLIKAIARSMLIMGTTWFLGPIFGSVLQSFTDWRGLGILLALASLLLLALVLWKLPDTMTLEDRTKTTAREVLNGFVRLLKDRVFLGLVLVQVTISISLYSYLNISTFVYGNSYGVGATQVGFFLAINSACSYAGAQLGALLSRKYKPQYVLLGTQLLGVSAGTALIFIAIFHLPFIIFSVAIALFVMSFGSAITPILGLAMDSHPHEAGTAAAVITFAGTFAATLAGPLYAVLDHTTSIGIGIEIVTTLSIGIILLFAIVRPKQLEAMK